MTPFTWKGIATGVLVDWGVTAERDLPGVAIPYRSADGATARVKFFRDDGGPSFWGAGVDVHLLGADRLGFYDRRQPVLVCEGESDTICASAFDFQSVGAPGSSTWRATWAELLTEFEVVVVGDGDEAGRRFEQAVRKSIPAAALVRLDDGDDLRALLQRGGLEQFERQVAEARLAVRTEAAIFAAQSLEECEQLLAAGMPMDEIRSTLTAVSRGSRFSSANTLARFTTVELQCATCRQATPHHLAGSWLCVACEAG